MPEHRRDVAVGQAARDPEGLAGGHEPLAPQRSARCASMTVGGRAVRLASVRCLTCGPTRYDWRSRTETYSLPSWTRRTLATCNAPVARLAMRESSHTWVRCQAIFWLQQIARNADA